jgi:hypothetical protein
LVQQVARVQLRGLGLLPLAAGETLTVLVVDDENAQFHALGHGASLPAGARP